ncbi:3,4-dihydroxy-2-butanone-4-phosphate synthase [Thermoplasmatales archaeon ex4572_165]|nr:MAG: 3,4-dihydroxy-2-butanone-4-phosphate synthase [Thermoplasmatales archaeon ex4572_165]
MSTLNQAISDLQQGKFILVFDDDKRENETDFFIASEFLTASSIRTLRQDGGGLIFLMISSEIGKSFQLPFLSDLFIHAESEFPVLSQLIADDIPYDSKSSFSIYINHRETFTGITDEDRCLTMKRFAELTKQLSSKKNVDNIKKLGDEFRSPGHVPICIASEKPLTTRFGHTELAVSILKMAGLNPVASGCEIMGDNGKSLSKSKARQYAKDHDLCFLEGKEIIEAWNKWSQ